MGSLRVYDDLRAAEREAEKLNAKSSGFKYGVYDTDRGFTVRRIFTKRVDKSTRFLTDSDGKLVSKQ